MESNLYAISLQASRWLGKEADVQSSSEALVVKVPMEIAHVAVYVIASTLPKARNWAIKMAKAQFPIDKGWKEYSVSVVQVPRKQLERLSV